ncbi:MAG: outer membrane beta-barrel protein [Cyclobacteriaceae bacterium]|nr:outer membrane beta-barrel protein [Cyclobacteriaceae bacterium HetDA_MAG_MS6]
MSNQGRSMEGFEEQWKDALNDAEVTPPPVVWSEIDASLANWQAKRYKKRAVIYKWAAVGAILIAATATAMQFFTLRNGFDLAEDVAISTENELATIQPANTEQSESLYPEVRAFIPVPYVKESIAATNVHDQNSAETTVANGKENVSSRNSHTSIRKNVVNTPSVNYAAPISLVSEDDDLQKREPMEVYQIASKRTPEINQNPVDPKDRWIYRVPINSNYLLAAVNRSRQKGFWAGVDIGSGIFDPNYDLNSSSDLSLAATGQNESFLNLDAARSDQPSSVVEGMSAGVIYTAGLNIGMNLSRRWTLEGGVQYGRYGATSKTNTTVQHNGFSRRVPVTSEAANVPEIADLADEQDIVKVTTENVDLQNTFQFASIPLKAGYVLVDKKLNIRVNAGLAANLYFGNVLESKDDPNIASISLSPGEDSPYRELNVLGLAGVEFGYQVLRKISLTLEPNYRYSLQSLTKDQENFTSVPSIFGIEAGLRFSFN